MDKICGAVLDKINSLSPSGRYVVIAEDEFYDCFPDGDESGERLDRALTLLKEGGYIDVKYSRGDLFCIAPLKEYIEEEPAEDAEDMDEAPKRKINFTFASAFLGGMLGSLIISLIFALV
ncbi:MAG: hypothetical protein K2H30_02495 [Clostridia bacterium]|nr:hypothetical protein [Clostridia bacterium]